MPFATLVRRKEREHETMACPLCQRNIDTISICAAGDNFLILYGHATVDEYGRPKRVGCKHSVWRFADEAKIIHESMWQAAKQFQ